MSVKFHYNPVSGATGACSAKSAESCPFIQEARKLGIEEDIHFDTLQEAAQAYEKVMSSLTFKNTFSKNTLQDKFLNNIDVLTFDEIKKFTHGSRKNFSLISAAIKDRGQKSVVQGEKLEKENPFENPDSLCDKDTFKRLRKIHNEFLDKTAELIEASTSSKFYKPLYENRTFDKVGEAVKVHSYDTHSTEWYETRFNSVGGSDVGVLAKIDFTPEEDRKYWDAQAFARVEKSKKQMPTEEDIANAQKLSHTSRSGPLYRGTVAEDWIRNEFANRNPDLKVSNVKDQFRGKDFDWQQVNFDGVYSDKGSEKIKGLLEIKTGSSPKVWKDGIPIGYRAQVLYCLRSTGLKEAKVVALLNNGDYREYTLKDTDPIFPGDKKTTMDKYLFNRIKPWFEGIKNEING